MANDMVRHITATVTANMQELFQSQARKVMESLKETQDERR